MRTSSSHNGSYLSVSMAFGKEGVCVPRLEMSAVLFYIAGGMLGGGGGPGFIQ